MPKFSITQSLNYFITLAAFQGAAWACPFCKEALLDPGQAASQSRLARGYAMSIAVLLGVPVVVMGVIAWRLVRAARRPH